LSIALFFFVDFVPIRDSLDRVTEVLATGGDFMRLSAILCASISCLATQAVAVPKTGTGISTEGVIAYQDHQDPKQWHYYPLRTDLAPNGGIISFTGTHWGFGPAFYSCPDGSTTNCYSAVGGLVGGSVAINYSPSQKREILRAISAATGIPQPQIKLIPVKLRNVSLQPTLGAGTLEFGKNSDQIYPKAIDLGSTFNYTVGTGGSLFPAILAAGDADSYEVTKNDHFGLNVAAEFEVEADPWEGTAQCDLKQVWSEIRKTFSASVSWGWFELGNGSYDGLWRDLQKSGACKLTLTSGSLDTKAYGEQMFKLTEELFKKINEQAAANQGFFKFEPNPESEAFTKEVRVAGLFSSLRSVKVNASYSEKHFTQSINWQTSFKYTGRFYMPIHFGVTLALQCNQATKHMFRDLGDTSEPCLTQAKVDEFNRRAATEKKAKDKVVLKLLDRLLAGEIDEDRYERALETLAKVSLTESLIAKQGSLSNKSTGTTFTEESVDSAIANFLSGV
jgi:hypothetical protein